MSNDTILKGTISKSDAFANFATGVGGPVDKSQYSYFQRGRILQEIELDNMYMQSAISARIVDRLVDDATREGFTLSGPDQEFDFSSLMSSLENYGIVEIVNDAWKQARLYGGTLIVLAVNDASKYTEPLDYENLTNLIGMRVIPSIRATPSYLSYGFGSNSYMKPRTYQIQSLKGKHKEIHSSRTIRIEGIRSMPEHLKRELNNGWGPSVLQRVYTEISNLGQSEGYLSTIMHDASVPVWKMENFYTQLCGTKDGAKNMRAQIEAQRSLADNLHVLLMDKDDEYVEANRDVTGLEKIDDKFVEALVRATEMPRTIILGEQPGGLNTSADGEVRGWYDFVHATQKNTLTPIINQILKIIFKIRENQGQPVPSEWTIEYKPLWQPSEQEQADTLLKNMQAAQIAITSAVAKPGEIRLKLISEGYLEASVEEEEEEASQQTQPLLVGTFQGIQMMMEKVNQGLMTPSQARALAEQSAPQFAGNEKLLMSLFPERPEGAPPQNMQPGADPLAQNMQPEVGIDLEGSENIALEVEPEAAASLEPVPPDLMRTKEAAAMLGVPTVTINNMCRKGELPYWQFGSRKQVSMQDLIKAGKKTDSTCTYLKKIDAKSAGLFFRIPDSVISAAGLPPLLNDNQITPYHITFLIMEDIGGRYSEFEKLVERTLSKVGEITVGLESTKKVANSMVAMADFDKDMNMIRHMLINVLEYNGFKVNKKYPEWEPHMTLSYQTDPETGEIFDNFRLKGDFILNQIEIWGLGAPMRIPLG